MAELYLCNLTTASPDSSTPSEETFCSKKNHYYIVISMKRKKVFGAIHCETIDFLRSSLEIDKSVCINFGRFACLNVGFETLLVINTIHY